MEITKKIAKEAALIWKLGSAERSAIATCPLGPAPQVSHQPPSRAHGGTGSDATTGCLVGAGPGRKRRLTQKDVFMPPFQVKFQILGPFQSSLCCD